MLETRDLNVHNVSERAIAIFIPLYFEFDCEAPEVFSGYPTLQENFAMSFHMFTTPHSIMVQNHPDSLNINNKSIA